MVEQSSEQTEQQQKETQVSAAGMKRFAILLAVLLGALVFSVMFVGTSAAVAVVRCVPNVSVHSTCSAGYLTLQAALNAVVPGDRVYVGAGAPAERVTVSKFVIIYTLPGHEFTDVGLDPSSEALVTFTAGNRSTIQGANGAVPTFRVTASGAAFRALAGPKYVTLKKGLITCEDSGAIGIDIQGSERATLAGTSGALTNKIRIHGCAVGLRSVRTLWLKASHFALTNNAVGTLLMHTTGQYFYTVSTGNGIGLLACANDLLDVNSGKWTGNGVAIKECLTESPNPRTGLTVGRILEYNFHTIETSAGPAYQIETTPGVFSPHREDTPSCSATWGRNVVDGLLLPTVITRPC